MDDDEDTLRALDLLLRAEGFQVSTAADGEAALSQARCELPSVVLTDLQMPLIGGLDLCRRLHEIDRDLPVIVMTGFSNMNSVIETLRAGAEDYLIKPLQEDAVVWCVERAISRRAALREQEELSRLVNEHLVLSSIREQEHAEVEAEEHAKLNALLENLEEGVAIVDGTGQVLMLNRSAYAILGADHDLATIAALHALDACDLRGQPLPPDQRPVARALRGEQFANYEVLQVTPNGELRRVASTGTCVRDGTGRVALAIVVFRDVTQLRRLEQQREEYLSLITHDLRNPLTSILFFVQTLKRSMDKKGPGDDPTAKLAERAERNVKQMGAMLEELTEATSLESHGVTLRLAPCDLRALVADVVDRMDDVRKGRLVLEADDGSPMVVRADASRIERVVSNLVTNALKYSADDARVSVRLARKGSDVALEVSDQGIGIAPESVKMLFDRYYRTGGGKARARGLGLGLYIARLIVEAHGGRIDVSSVVGEGSTFKVLLPG